MTDRLQVLRKELESLRAKVKEEQEEKKIEEELFELRNRRTLRDLRAKKENRQKLIAKAKKIIAGGAKAIGSAGRELERVRSDSAVKQRLQTVHGIRSGTSKKKLTRSQRKLLAKAMRGKKLTKSERRKLRSSSRGTARPRREIMAQQPYSDFDLTGGEIGFGARTNRRDNWNNDLNSPSGLL